MEEELIALAKDVQQVTVEAEVLKKALEFRVFELEFEVDELQDSRKLLVTEASEREDTLRHLSAELMDLKTNRSSLETTTTTLSAEVETLKRMLETKTRECLTAAALQHDLEGEIAKRDAELKTLRDDMSLLEKALKNLKEERDLLRDANESVLLDAETRDLQARETIRSLQDTINTLQSELQSSSLTTEAKEEETKVLKSLLKDVEKRLTESERLRKELKIVEEDDLQRCPVHHKTLEAELQSANEKLQASDKILEDKHAAEQQVIALERSLSEIKEKAQQDVTSAVADIKRKAEMKLGKMRKECERKLTELRTEHQRQIETFRAESDRVQATICDDNIDGQVGMKADVSHVKNSRGDADALQLGNNTNNQLTAQLCKAQDTIDALQSMIVQLEQENVQNVNRCESAATELSFLRAKEEGRLAEIQTFQERANGLVEDRDKMSRQLKRLQEHLLLMEQTSTQETIEAEKREKQLRDELAACAKQTDAASQSALENRQLMAQISSLRKEVAKQSSEAAEWRSRCLAEEESRREIALQLSQLQAVVRDLVSDHEKALAEAQQKNINSLHQITALQSQMVELKTLVEQSRLDAQAAEDTAECLRERLAQRESTVEELESQLEEAHAATTKLRNSREGEYRVDDATLRQLFLSLFTAEPDRRPEISLLLASVLGYQEADMARVRAAVGRGDQRRPRQPTGPSIAEQFIRFLENESESASTAPQLPVPHEKSVLSSSQPASSPHTDVSTLNSFVH